MKRHAARVYACSTYGNLMHHPSDWLFRFKMGHCFIELGLIIKLLEKLRVWFWGRGLNFTNPKAVWDVLSFLNFKFSKFFEVLRNIGIYKCSLKVTKVVIELPKIWNKGKHTLFCLILPRLRIVKSSSIYDNLAAKTKYLNSKIGRFLLKIRTNKASRFTVQGSYSSFTLITMTFEELHLFSNEPTIIIVMMIIISHEKMAF